MWIAIATATLFGMFGLVGCSTEHADVKDAVNSALTSNNLGVVSVSQDRDKGVITLTGDVESEDKKMLAETVAKRLADLQKQIAPLKSDRLEHHAIIHRLKFEEVVSKTADKARAAREKAEAELAELQSRMTPLQTEINQLTRQFWVSKDKVKANKYDLSASRYRQVEQDEEFYEQPSVTLDRMRKLEAVAASQVAVLSQVLTK